MRGIFGTIGFLVISLPSWGASGFNYQPVARSQTEASSLDEDHKWGLAFSSYSVIPFNIPFKKNSSGTLSNLRYETSTGFQLEFSLANLVKNVELAASTGVEAYNTRTVREGADTNQYQSVEFKQIPIDLIARYFFGEGNWRPEVEVGAGLGIGTLKVTSTDQSFATTSNSIKSLRFQAGFGTAYAWTDDFSLHMKAGFAFRGVGSQSFALETGSSPKTVETSSIYGLLAKAEIRWVF